MRTKPIIFLFAAILLALSCQKETAPVLPQGTPMFSLSGLVDGSPLMIQAGQDGYFMYTQLRQDTNGVLAMGGFLLRDTADKRSGFFLNFRDPDEPGSGQQTPMDSALAPGVHPLYHFTGEKEEEHLHQVLLQMTDSLNVTQQIWDLGNGQFSTNQQVEVVYDDRQQLQYPVKLISTRTGGCSDGITHYIDLAQQSDCKARFGFVQQNAYSIECQTQFSSGIVTQVNWSLNGNSYGNGLNAQISALTSGTHEICATYTFDNGCFHVVCRSIEVDASGTVTNASCQNDFNFDRENVYVYDSLQYGRVELLYYDEQGRIYSSYYTENPSELEVISSSPYEPDAWGRNTRSVRFRYTGELRSKSGQPVQVDQLTGVMAIATPE